MGASGRAASGRWMRGSAAIVALVAGLLAAGAGRAEPFLYEGSLALSIGGFGGIGVPGHGTADVTATGTHLDAFALGVGDFHASGLTVTVPASAAPIGGVQITAQNGAGTFVRPNGGVMPILGSARACLFGACSVAVANLVVPLSIVGVGGTVTASGPVNLTVIGAPWTTGTAVVGTATAMGFARGPASQSSSTARASGEIQLVTPIRILTNLPGDFAELPAFGLLTLHFVPEPTTVVLLGAGLVATTAAARRRRRAVRD